MCLRSSGGDLLLVVEERRCGMDVVVDRCAALDVHLKTVQACVRVAGEAGKREEKSRGFDTFTQGLRALRNWLEAEGVTKVAMEATGVYWRPVWYMLQDLEGVELLLVNARHVKNVPGRKTDTKDAQWLCQLLECGLLKGSFVPTEAMQKLRDLTRYRTRMVKDRGSEVQRIHKVLEDAGLKLEAVISDVLGVSGRKMLEALIAGERSPDVLAEMSMRRMRSKIPTLNLALEGHFGEHHAVMARLHLDHIDYLDAAIDRVEQEVDELMAPFKGAVEHLVTIPGIATTTAHVVVAEIGVDMSRFPTAGHLASWAGLCPGNYESAGKSRSGKTGKGNSALASAMCEAAWAASRTKDTYLSEQFKRFLRRFGKRGANRAIVALAHTLIVIVWHVLANQTDYVDLGPDFFRRLDNPEAQKQRLIRQLEALGLEVTVQPAA
jgi:transposase